MLLLLWYWKVGNTYGNDETLSLMSDNAVDYCFHILMAISVVVFNVLVREVHPSRGVDSLVHCS